MENNNLNLIITVILSILIIVGWQHFVEGPNRQNIKNKSKIEQNLNSLKSNEINNSSISDFNSQINNKSQSIKNSKPSKRVMIQTPELKGTLNTKGARIDDLRLSKYKENITKDSEAVRLLSPTATENAYFTEIGWIGDTESELPNSSTIWEDYGNSLTAKSNLTLKHVNKNGVEFILEYSIKEDSLINVKQKIINNSKRVINARPYGLINRNYISDGQNLSIVHQGLIGNIAGELKEITYDALKSNKYEKYSDQNLEWIGMTDKYWLCAYIPDQNYKYTSNFNYVEINNSDKYQADFIGSYILVPPGAEKSVSHNIFIGAKKVDILENYAKKYNIALFDRAIDFGNLYILTKPLFYTLNFINNFLGNFGLSILAITVLIKILMFGFANKSYNSMKKIKALQPEIERIKTLYSEDKAKLNQEMMSLYKKEKVNPFSGCLPILVQVPIFFAIYKVLNVTIEMRHAPFYGWISDLSARDPLCVVNLFGILKFTPPEFLQIGIWPILMVITMYIQQLTSPQPADQTQAQVMRLMPIIFLFMFASFPAGLLIYWTWSNLLSIAQQYYINKISN